MDKKLFLSTLLVLAIMLVTAQTPLLFNYQTVVRDANGIILANEEISVTIEILKNEPSGEVIFSESHSVTTSPHGVVSLQIGSNNDLNTVSWGSSTHYLRVKINDIVVGTSQILSVPYAIHAKTAENLSEEIVEQDPVFSAWDKSTGIVLTESQISDLQLYITEENDPSFTDNFDFSNAEANDLLRFDGSKWAKFTPEYLTNFTETDPSFASWDKSTGIEIVESQITDFKEYLLSEVDPQVSANFDFSESQEGDLLMFNGEKWVKFSPNYLTEFTESQNLADVISAGNDAGNNQIKNVANPTDDQDAATKSYVDNSSMPAGTEPGDMMYWDGNQWLQVAPGTHGEFLTFCDGKPTWGFCLAKLTTTEVTDYIGSNAVSGGTITNMGGSPIIQKGVCWSTNPEPTIDDNFTNDGEGSESFTSKITGLTSGVIYYVRAYAINSGGVSYGNEISCTTIITLPSVSTIEVFDIMALDAKCSIEVENTGGDAIVAGVCWSTSTNPTIADSKTEDVTESGSFTCNITGLDVSTIYYVKAYATNSEGTVYGDEYSFETQNGIAEIYTMDPYNITATSALSGGLTNSDGGSIITQYGVCWSTNPNPTISDNISIDGDGLNLFYSSITNLDPNTTYYVRAYAINEVDTYYGEEYSFTTQSGIPTISTIEPTNILVTSAESGGIIDDDGGAEITLKGVCWSTSPNPTVNDSKTENGAGIEIFNCTVENLDVNTTYYIRAYVENMFGVFYGNELSFTTLDGSPLVSTSAISNITSVGFDGGGEVTEDFSSPVTARGICWSTSPNPTIADNYTEDGTGLGAFTSSASSLTEWEMYYVRAYATNANGTGYGEELRFMANDPITDIDGNSYATVKIGDQIWMAENLKVTQLNDGSAIFSVYPKARYFWYDNDISYKDTYGALYNGYVALTPNVCPVGWHVPTDTEWTTLTNYLGGEAVAGGKLKEEGIEHWLDPNNGATNESLFTALPAGRRTYTDIIDYDAMQYATWFWTSTFDGLEMLHNRYIFNSTSSITKGSSMLAMFDLWNESFSIRCIKD